MNINFYTLDRFPFLNTLILQSRISWSIRLRWLALAGYFIVTLVAKNLSSLTFPYQRIWLTLGTLALLNLLYVIILKIFKEFSFFTELVILHIHIIIDLVFLTLLIHFSGGIENPIYLFYIFHVVISSVVFPRFLPLVFATLVIILFSTLAILEYAGIIPHYSIFGLEIHDNPLNLFLILVVFAITIYFTEYICTTFMRIYRDSKRIIDRQNHQLLEADKQKSRFFRFASHELKAPIIAVKSSIDGVVKTFSGSMDEKALNLLQRASSRSGQMLEIINELLELSRHSKIPDELPERSIIINNVLQMVIQQEKSLLEEKRMDLVLNLSAKEIVLKGREVDFERLFLNLIDNAIRYSPENSQVLVETLINEEFFVFKVQDRGIGIAEEDQNKIFDEFFRSENAKKTVAFGTGLGLSLVKQIVENYQGEITVTSQLNQGTTITVKLPMSKNHHQ